MSRHKRLPQQPLDPGEVPKVGALYHTAWAWKNGQVWRCESVDEKKQTVQLITPKTHKRVRYPTKWEDLRITRKQEMKRQSPQYDDAQHI